MCWSCSKKTTGPATQEAVADSTVPAARGTFDMLAASYAPWHDISAPIKLEMRQPSKISLSARAVMVRDSAVSISIRVFGFEVGSLYADKDSVIAIVKPNKLAYAQNTSKLLKAAGLTFGDLQSALMGQMFARQRHCDNRQFRRFQHRQFRRYHCRDIYPGVQQPPR